MCVNVRRKVLLFIYLSCFYKSFTDQRFLSAVCQVTASLCCNIVLYFSTNLVISAGFSFFTQCCVRTLFEPLPGQSGQCDMRPWNMLHFYLKLIFFLLFFIFLEGVVWICTFLCSMTHVTRSWQMYWQFIYFQQITKNKNVFKDVFPVCFSSSITTR